MQTIEVVFEKGKATVSTAGFTGTGCLLATEALKKALGVVESEDLTREGLTERPERQEVHRGR